MTEPIHDKIKRSLQAAEGLYHRLVLLVGETGSGKTGVLRDVADDFGTSIININLALSSELLELTTKQRSLRLPEIFSQITDKSQSPVILDNLEPYNKTVIRTLRLPRPGRIGNPPAARSQGRRPCALHFADGRSVANRCP